MTITRSITNKGAYMIGTDCQGSTTNAQQHNSFCPADGQNTPRMRGWKTSIVRNEDMDDIERNNNTIDDTHEEMHTNMVHFIS